MKQEFLWKPQNRSGPALRFAKVLMLELKPGRTAGNPWVLISIPFLRIIYTHSFQRTLQLEFPPIIHY